jgi:hypothetical protein
MLYQNYPNPFNASTNFVFRIPASLASRRSRGPAGGSDFGFVTLKIYDLLGREVAIIVNGEKPAGVYNVKFDADNLSSGVYFYSLKAGEFFQTKKFVLLK